MNMPDPVNLESLDILASPLVKNPILHAEVSRELSPEDLVILETTPLKSTTPLLKRVRASHHAAARLIATGMKDVEVGAVVGYSQTRLSILKNDPAFMDLIEFYTEREDARFGVVRDRLELLGFDVVEVLHERVLDDPEEMTTKSLVDVMTAVLDRSGHSPIQRTKAETGLSDEELLKIKEAVKGSQLGSVMAQGEVLDGEATEISTGKESPVGGATSDRPRLETKESAGIESEGAGV